MEMNEWNAGLLRKENAWTDPTFTSALCSSICFLVGSMKSIIERLWGALFDGARWVCRVGEELWFALHLITVFNLDQVKFEALFSTCTHELIWTMLILNPANHWRRAGHNNYSGPYYF